MHRAKPEPLWEKSLDKHSKAELIRLQDFQVAEDFSHGICPTGKRLYRNGNIGGRRAVKLTGAQRDCENCPLRAQGLHHPRSSKVRQVAIFVVTHVQIEEAATERMKRKTDTDKGREMITRWFATIESTAVRKAWARQAHANYHYQKDYRDSQSSTHRLCSYHSQLSWRVKPCLRQ